MIFVACGIGLASLGVALIALAFALRARRAAKDANEQLNRLIGNNTWLEF